MLKSLKKKVIFLIVTVMLVTVFPTGMAQNVTAATKTTAKKTITITSISDLKKTVKVDEKFTMPSTIVAVMSDKTKKKVSVKWNKDLNSNVDGVYTSLGTVTGYSKKVKFTLTVTAPKTGTINIPKVTDSTIKKPSGIRFGIGTETAWFGDQSMELDKTLLSVFWSPENKEADEYRICIYDQYKRVVSENGICLNDDDYAKKELEYTLHLDKIKNLTISTITITPVKTTEEGRMTGDNSKNGVGETAIFDCSIKVTAKIAKKVTMSQKENDLSSYLLTFSNKIAPYTYFELFSEYKFISSDLYGVTYRGEFSAEDGTVNFTCLNDDLDKSIYMADTSKLTLLVYTNPVVESSSTGSFTITVYPVNNQTSK